MKLLGDVRRFNGYKPKRLRAARRELQRTYPDAVARLNDAQLSEARRHLRAVRRVRYAALLVLAILAVGVIALRRAVLHGQ